MSRSIASWALCVVLLTLFVVRPASATGQSTITFAEHAPGTALDTEYAALGVRFGKAADFGVTLAGAWDCGAPIVKEPTSDGPPPRVAQAPLCGGRSGTVVAFAYPRRTIRLVVAATPSTDRDAEVLAYDRTGRLVTRSEAVASFQAIAIERPSPDVSFLAVQLDGEGTSAVLFDDLSFDHLGDPLTVAPRGVGATVGAERTDNVARLTDADPTATAADYRVTIEWGDGQSSAGRLVASGDGYDVVGTYTYAATGTFTVRTTVEKVNGVRATATSTARVVDRPDFEVAVTPGSASVSQGTSGRFTVSVSPLAGFTGTVSLSLAGAGGTFSPATVAVPGSSQLAVSTTAATAPAAYPLTITATSGSLARSATTTLTVTRAAPTVVARLATPRPAPALSLVTLDARGSKGAASYRWDLNGDRRADVECGKTTPVLVARLRTPGARTVRLSAVALDGKTSVARRTLRIRKRPAGGASGSRPLELARCLRDTRNRTRIACTRAFHEKVVFGLVEVTGCLTRAASREKVPAGERLAFDAYRGNPALADPLVSHDPVRLNGITFSPVGDASIVVFPQLQRIVSSRAEIRLGAIRVRAADSVNLALNDRIARPPLAGTLGKRGQRARLLTFDTTGTPLTRELGGFGLAGTAELHLVKRLTTYTSEMKVSLTVPPELRLLAGELPTGQTTIRAGNGKGLDLDELRVEVPEANLGGVRLTNILFEYKARGNPEFNCPRKWWKATANVFLGQSATSGGFRLAPEPRRNGLAFCAGSFHSAGGEIVFNQPLPRPQLFPGVVLKTLGFETQLDPTILVGTATISAYGLTDMSGGLLVAFPSPSAPYRIEAGDVKGSLGKLVGRTFVAPTIAIGANFDFEVSSSVAIPFANAYFAYSAPDYVALGGGIQMIIPGGTIKASVDGEMRVSQALFSIHGSAELCFVALVCPIVGAEAWVTSTGVVVCGSIAGALHPGVGYRWGDTWPEVWLVDGCTPSPYWVNAGPPTALSLAPFAANATTSFTVAPGERSKNVRLDGVGGAPRVEVRGPDGELVSTAAGDFARGKTINVLRQDAGKVTWIGVAPARAGRYTITTLPGSAAIRELAATRPLADRLRVSVAGKGSARLLRYDVARVAGRRVTFFESGRASYRRLGAVTGGRGVIPFRPAPGAAGVRRIVARVELRGTPTPDRVVARYRVAPPKRLGRPAALRLQRSGRNVSVSWARVGGATGYALVARLSSGVQRVKRLNGQRTRLRLAAIPPTQAGTVTVRALGPLGARGPAARGRFAAPKREPSPFRPFSELGRRAARR